MARAWDPFLGRNRVERARSFQRGLDAAGFSSQLTIYPNIGHGVNGRMRESAVSFLEALALAPAAGPHPQRLVSPAPEDDVQWTPLKLSTAARRSGTSNGFAR